MKVLICGYVGGGNCGDEAICDRLIAAIRAQGDRVKLLSLTPSESMVLHHIPALSRRFPKPINALWECDLFVLGGGTLLQMQTSRRSAVYYLSLAALAAAMGKPWVLLGGIDPLSGGAGEGYTSHRAGVFPAGSGQPPTSKIACAVRPPILPPRQRAPSL